MVEPSWADPQDDRAFEAMTDPAGMLILAADGRDGLNYQVVLSADNAHRLIDSLVRAGWVTRTD
jgi:hypothetical protein